MTTASLLRIYKIGLLVVFFGIFFHAPLSVWLGSLLPEWALVFKIWKEVLIFILLLVAVTLVTLKQLWPQIVKDRVIQLVIAYCVLHVLLLPFFWQGLLPSVAGLMIDLRFVVFFVLCYVAARMDSGFITVAIKAVVAGAALVVGFGLLQITILPDDILAHIGYSNETIRPFTTIDRNTDFIRINSTLRGPNPLGALCVLFIALLTSYGISHYATLRIRWRLGITLALLGTVAVLFASFSRSAFLGALITVATIALLSVSRKLSWKWAAIGVGAIVAALVGFIGLQQTDWYSNVILHEDPESTVMLKSNAEHVRSLGVGAQRILSQPLGAGIGSTGSASLYDDSNGQIIENYYLFVGHESGWLGFALFIIISIIVLVRLWQYRQNWLARAVFASGIGLVVIGLLLPVWADETVALVWWGLAGSIIGGEYEKRARKQKAARTP